ncbi:Putative auto-transporter adhesin, head GIN domain [Salinimicrobium sediminis]|uniref:Auto-transporter adhesin, head GIN domain n=1 Tax=Salinimicrobium sediminis TaxID=1343891 RepID=A0A285X898_9FLAO|nr:head GIN domain-containing protein [Salinimicrobium sediminis]MDX1754065.1 head GIN domain-containing protein [Salinimicrobium sediminis]SOC81246.1 Putative auto-transporter adhesin, head GIN domain [Salinimicrobium sediminis]
MKKLFTTLLLTFISITASQAQWWQGTKEINGNGNVITQTRNVSDYDAVDLTGSMDVILIKGREGNIKVEAEENLQQHITTEVSGGKLKISVEKGYSLNPSRNSDIIITVPFTDLDAVSLTGSGDIRSSDMITTKDFSLSVTGSGNIKLPVQAENTSASITGSGDIDLKGSSTEFNCKVTGSGDISAFDFKAQHVRVTVTGSGDVQVYASESLKASTPGSGDIEYRGNPKKEDFRTMGSGSISKN